MASGTAPFPPSLVKYETPQLVGGAPPKPLSASKKGRAKLPPMESSTSKEPLTNLLDQILPPREWQEDGQLWIQRVSSTPATRLDVKNLQEVVERQLKERKARETGLCPVRQEIYSQLFDELIRQEAINCFERGQLLLKVRDEMRMTLKTYQTLYESAVAYGMRKALQAEQGKADLEAKIKQLEDEKRDLEAQRDEWRSRCEAIEKRESEHRAAEEKKHADEVAFLKRTNLQLKTQLESILKKS